MSANSISTIAFIGFGEVSQTFSRGFSTRPEVALATFDILFDDAVRAGALRDRAAELGVRAAGSAGEAVAGADVVISAVTATAVLDVAATLAPSLKPGQIVLDVNSASPNTKCRAAGIVQAAGADYLEGAVMAPVLAPGLRVPILAGGPRAAEIAERLNTLGMNLRAVSVEHGRASAMKLCRSIVVKGLEAIMVDCAAATRGWNVADEVFSSLRETWPAIDWADLAGYMGERVATHGVRRAAEMREAADMLAELGLDASLARAIADAQQRGAKHKTQ